MGLTHPSFNRMQSNLSPATEVAALPTPTSTQPPIQGSSPTQESTRTAAQCTAGLRRRNRRQAQTPLIQSAAGISRKTWANMAIIDAVPILQLNIIALNKCPQNFRNVWRHALTEVNMAGQSEGPVIRKGAEITLTCSS